MAGISHKCATMCSHAHQCDCADFEAMHKWALKIFMRSVPHGSCMTSRVMGKHMAQLLYSKPTPDAAPVPDRPCRCGEDPCTHPLHVHVDMPGLRENPADGRWRRLRDQKGNVDNRGVTKCNFATDSTVRFRRALVHYIAASNGVHFNQQKAYPTHYYTANTMTLRWHKGREGKVDLEEVQPSG